MKSNFLYPLLVSIFGPIILGIISKISTGDFVNLLKYIPVYLWIIFALIIILWLLIISRNRRSQYANKPKCHSAVSVGASSSETPHISTLTLYDVKWRIYGWILRDGISPENIEAITPPRCPACETEIDEKPLLFGGYRWKCPRCSFSKFSKNSFNILRKSVSKVARREYEVWLEKEIIKRGSNNNSRVKPKPTGYDAY